MSINGGILTGLKDTAPSSTKTLNNIRSYGSLYQFGQTYSVTYGGFFPCLLIWDSNQLLEATQLDFLISQPSGDNAITGLKIWSGEQAAQFDADFNYIHINDAQNVDVILKHHL